jgi:hypothetical protein
MRGEVQHRGLPGWVWAWLGGGEVGWGTRGLNDAFGGGVDALLALQHYALWRVRKGIGLK